VPNAVTPVRQLYRPYTPYSRMGGAGIGGNPPFRPMYSTQPPSTARTWPMRPPPPSQTPAEEVKTDPLMLKLQQEFAKMTVGSAQREQILQTARSQGRCFNCFSRQHQSRNCPNRAFSASSAQWMTTGSSSDFDYEAECEKYDREHECETSSEEQDPESAQ
jgi:hypothetical protein